VTPFEEYNECQRFQWAALVGRRFQAIEDDGGEPVLLFEGGVRVYVMMANGWGTAVIETPGVEQKPYRPPWVDA
jgi:hypothetical protein